MLLARPLIAILLALILCHLCQDSASAQFKSRFKRRTVGDLPTTPASSDPSSPSASPSRSNTDKSGTDKSGAGSVTATGLIGSHTSYSGLDEDGLGKDLAGRLPDQADLSTHVLRELGWFDQDDVAVAISKTLTDKQIRDLAKTPEGRRLLGQILAALVEGHEVGDEEPQRHRIVKIATQELANGKLPKQPGKASPIDARLLTDFAIEEMAKTPQGRAQLLATVDQLFENGTSLLGSSDEAHRRMARIMNIITKVDNERRTSAPRVEVITFVEGSLGYDGAEAVIGRGAKGHTALIIGDLVYSFEGKGWSVGRTRDQYLKIKGRQAVGQVLDLKPDEIKELQNFLNNSAGKGNYFWDGVCTSMVAQALARIWPGVKSGRWNPPQFVGHLDDNGRVKDHVIYPRY